MKKLFCGSVISLIGTIFSTVLISMATINGVHGGGQAGLWGLLCGYNAVFPTIVSLIAVAAGIILCVWGAFEKKE